MRKVLQFVVVISAVLILVVTMQDRAFSGMWEAAETAVSADGVWADVSARGLNVAGEQTIQPSQYRTLALRTDALTPLLASAPLEFTSAATQSPVELDLPLPDGTYGRFQIVESPIMEAALAAKYPTIKTYAGQGIDDPAATVRFDVTPLGFHAQILSPNGRIFIDPLTNQTTTYYMSYYTRDYTSSNPAELEFSEEVKQLNDNPSSQSQSQITGVATQLRTYRLALAASGEYTQHFGGKSNAIAQMITSINRVNGIYIRDLASKLQFIGNNDQIVYENPATDPYTGDYLTENQIALDSTIGNSNYDIGHVVTLGSGGVAYLGVVCDNGFKAGGTTGRPNPVGDPFDVDYLAHELGHQFGGPHTFNNDNGSSCIGNRSAANAYEPGSGSTIMAYAGICGAAANLQANSDPYFHVGSILKINTYLATTSCGTLTGSNNPPTANAGNDYTIPANTPFLLTGVANDVDNDSLTYAWEEFDLGPANQLDNANATTAPIFRSFNPTTYPQRAFPQMSDTASGTQTKGEILPNVSRTFNFKLTVRDNQATVGAIAVDDMQLFVNNAAGPFTVTSLNAPAAYVVGDTETITWDVANTNIAPINCAEVNVTASSNGGLNFMDGLVLNTDTANDGSTTFTMPPINSTAVRIKVQCKDNVFFNINSANLTITGAKEVFLPIIMK